MVQLGITMLGGLEMSIPGTKLVKIELELGLVFGTGSKNWNSKPDSICVETKLELGFLNKKKKSKGKIGG
jgi:hypothetical protein